MEQRPLSRLESVECATSELAFPLLPVQELQLKDVEQRAAVVDVEARLDVERDAGVALVEAAPPCAAGSRASQSGGHARAASGHACGDGA